MKAKCDNDPMEKKVASQGLLLFLLVSLLITIEWSLAYIKLESKVIIPLKDMQQLLFSPG